jgi:hypothetical protein
MKHITIFHILLFLFGIMSFVAHGAEFARDSTLLINGTVPTEPCINVERTTTIVFILVAILVMSAIPIALILKGHQIAGLITLAVAIIASIGTYVCFSKYYGDPPTADAFGH